MSVFLGELVDSLSDVGDIERGAAPTPEVEENDHVVGQCCDELKKVYQMRDAAAKEFLELTQKLMRLVADCIGNPEPPAELEELGENLARAELRKSFFDQLFWTALRMEFPEITSKESIGVRKDWAVVWSEPKPQMQTLVLPLPPDLAKILQNFGKN